MDDYGYRHTIWRIKLCISVCVSEVLEMVFHEKIKKGSGTIF